jgi:hypothetical protein
MRFRRRLAAIEERLDALEAEPERPVWPKMPPRYDLSDELDVDGIWRAQVADHAAYADDDYWDDMPAIDRFGGYL